MLKLLEVENLAVIAHEEIEFGDGLNVFTGETGAGKTVLVGALTALTGERVSRELIRNGESKASVTALFTGISDELREKLSELGFDIGDDDELLISRVIKPNASECRICGKIASASVLREISGLLIDIHGQHDNSELFKPQYHLKLIDLYAGNDQISEEYRRQFSRLRKVAEEIKSLELDESERERRIELLEYTVDEISAASLRVGEEEELIRRRDIMRNSQTIAELLFEAKEIIMPEYGEAEGVSMQLSRLSDTADALSKYIPDFSVYAERIRDITYDIDEFAHEISSSSDDMNYSPQELSLCEERISLIHSLKQKYGEDEASILEKKSQAEEELNKLRYSDKRLEELSKRYEEYSKQTDECAKRLTESRLKAEKELAARIENELRELNMANVTIEFLHRPQKLDYSGGDYAELLFAPNRGEPPKPVIKTASGGEISRLMLSIKNVFSAEEDIVSVFDEIDTGVSGTSAGRIGFKLASAAKGRQIICITHLPQVASYADTHMMIEKTSDGEKTYTKVRKLNFEERAEELARIINGEVITELSLAGAKEMIEKAEEKKRGL